MINKKTFGMTFLILVLMSLVVAGCSNGSDSGETKIIVYKSQSCGCCGGYVSTLQSKKFDVEVVTTQDLDSIKSNFNIPTNMRSCHTTEVGDYFVEGHVPIEAVRKLIAEQPDIDGIALPNMPAGSPGMPGTKNGDFVIYSIKDGQSLEYMRI